MCYPPGCILWPPIAQDILQNHSVCVYVQCTVVMWLHFEGVVFYRHHFERAKQARARSSVRNGLSSIDGGVVVVFVKTYWAQSALSFANAHHAGSLKLQFNPTMLVFMWGACIAIAKQCAMQWALFSNRAMRYALLCNGNASTWRRAIVLDAGRALLLLFLTRLNFRF